MGTNPTVVEASPRESNVPVFLRKGRVGGFLTVVMAGQLTYAAFEAFKGSLMLPMTEALGIGIDQFGILMGWLGIAMFLYVPAGWINNRFTIRSILVAWCAWRLVTMSALYLVPQMPFSVMIVIAASWGVWDAIGWPAVVNGVSFMSRDADAEGRGVAMGLLESIRRAVEFLMNIVIIGLLFMFKEHTRTVMVVMGTVYSLTLIPLIACLFRFVPKNAVAEREDMSKNQAALVGLGKVLVKPRVWLAGLAALCVYWTYVNLIYSSAPYLQLVFQASDSMAGIFGVFNTGLVGVLAGLVSGVIADYVFRSSTMMMGVSLFVSAIGAGLIYLLPSSRGAMWPAIILLFVMALGTFMGKAVILAPIAELQLPEEINGSAMSVGSFLAYASIFWANPMTAGIVEAHRANPEVGYSKIFLITIAVSVVGAACAFTLQMLNRRSRRRAEALA